MRELTQYETQTVNGGFLGLKLSGDLSIESLLGDLAGSLDLCLFIGHDSGFCGHDEAPQDPVLA